MRKSIPNLITLLNLASGVIAILFASQNQLEYAAYFVILGIVLDFIDGWLARLIGAESEIGIQLDSLADVVTSGVAPGIFMFQLLRNADTDWILTEYLGDFKEISYLPFLGIIITLAAAYRLAKFNVNDKEDHDFIGLPTPAMALFIISLPLISEYGKFEWAMNLVNNNFFLIVVTILGSILMNSNLSLFSLKFDNYSFKDNVVKYLYLALSLILLLWLQVTAIPILIVLYILISLVNNMIKKD